MESTKKNSVVCVTYSANDKERTVEQSNGTVSVLNGNCATMKTRMKIDAVIALFYKETDNLLFCGV